MALLATTDYAVQHGHIAWKAKAFPEAGVPFASYGEKKVYVRVHRVLG